MSDLGDYGYKWIDTELGNYKFINALVRKEDDTEEIASIVKTVKEGKFIIEAKCENIGLEEMYEEEDEIKADAIILDIMYRIRDGIIKLEEL